MSRTIINLFGGRSDERHVSVASGQNIARALPESLHWYWAPNGAMYDVSRDELLAHERAFEIDYIPSRPAMWPDLEQALDTLPVEDPVFFLALHGGEGENGIVQRMLEQRGIPYTGSDSQVSAIAFDKEKAKENVKGRVKVPEARTVRSGREMAQAVQELLMHSSKVVLKPLAGGSSRGVFFIDLDEDPTNGIGQAASHRIPYLVEQFIEGRELTVGVIDQGDGPFALPVVEIEVERGLRFDYEAKYLGKGTREIVPAQIPAEMAKEAQDAALAAHIALGCSGYSRTDLIAAGDGVYFLELNTLPGLTITSLVPQELQAAGIAFREFLEKQIELAVARSPLAPRSGERVARSAG